jgi:hypothetical protein
MAQFANRLTTKVTKVHEGKVCVRRGGEEVSVSLCSAEKPGTVRPPVEKVPQFALAGDVRTLPAITATRRVILELARTAA